MGAAQQVQGQGCQVSRQGAETLGPRGPKEGSGPQGRHTSATFSRNE